MKNATKEIGEAFHSGEINKFTQLVAHAAVGYTTGEISNGDGASGAIGAVVGEVTAEIQQQRIEDRLKSELADGHITKEEAYQIATEMRNDGVDIARLAAGLSAALAGGDVNVAANAGATAAENNAFLVPVITLVGALWTAHDIATTYQEEGGEAVLKALAIDGVITIATAGAGKVVYKVGGKIFKSAPDAWKAVKQAKLWKKGDKLSSAAPAKRTTGETVLGSYPEYVKLSDDLNARRFEIPLDVWEKMTDAERWAANQKFLDRTINKGDVVTLSNDARKAKAGSYFEKEIEYLKSKGYSVSEDGFRLTPTST